MKKKLSFLFLVTIWTVVLICYMYMSDIFAGLYKTEVLTREAVQLLNEKMVYSVIGVGVITSIVAWVILQHILNQIVKPVEELTKEAHAFGKEKYTHSLRQYELEEMNALAIAFDKMCERFHRTVRKLRYEKSKAESVLGHLEEGILILDEEGYITEFNKGIEDYLAMPKEFKKCHVKNILRDPLCQNMLNNALEKGLPASCEVVKGERVLHIRTGLIQDSGEKAYGYIVTLTDITKTRQLEAIRYQFVTNVTHELKTPLTSIQGFVETLQNGAIENQEVAKRFLDIIDIETKRLYRLIQDILLLSEIENMDELCSEEVKLEEVVREVESLLEPEAMKKGIALEIKIEESIILTQVSYDHIKQIIVNLMGNAIKYTDQGQVCVTLGKESEQRILQVEDTGIGISQKHLPHVFERFYRVDKSRSRKSGGTGLGLSIVKHIVQLYQWEIDLISEENKGSTFKIKF